MLLLLGLAWVALPSPIEDFLQKNGFSDVKENFLENEVTLQVVGLLTDDDLTKLGLLTIGRRRLFNRVNREKKCKLEAPAISASVTGTSKTS